jgi:hypothetical protein
MCLSWHWDLEGMKLPLYRYRQLIAHSFATQGFAEHATTEPDISLEPGNILLVRVGKNVDQRTERQFFNHVMQKIQRTLW